MSLVSLHRHSGSTIKQQQGAALILALVVVMMVVLLATTMGNDFLVTFRRVENQLYGKQAEAYMRGAEGLARFALREDVTNSNAIDHVSELWLGMPQEYPIDEGVFLSAVICDVQARFNLNSLAGSPVSPALYTSSQETFIRLLQTLDKGIDQVQAQEITGAVIDWIDSDDNPHSTGGAETMTYSNLEPPYRAGNTLMHSTSELLWVEGMTDEIYQALNDHIMVAEDPGTLININTAGVNIQRSLNAARALTPITESEALLIISERDGDKNIPKDGFPDIAALMGRHPAGTTLDKSLLDVRSDIFLLESSTLFMDRKFKLYSILQREVDASGNVEIRTIARGSGLGKCSSP